MTIAKAFANIGFTKRTSAIAYTNPNSNLLPDAQVTVFGAQSGAFPDDPDLNAEIIGNLWGAFDIALSDSFKGNDLVAKKRTGILPVLFFLAVKLFTLRAIIEQQQASIAA